MSKKQKNRSGLGNEPVEFSQRPVSKEVVMTKRKLSRFDRWLNAAPEILEASTSAEKLYATKVLSKYLQTPATALVLIHGDGFIEVFGGQSLQVKILNLPIISTVDNELRLAELLDSLLPQRYKDIFFGGYNLRATGNIRTRTAKDIVSIVHQIELIHSIGDSSKAHYPTIKSKQLAALEA